LPLLGESGVTGLFARLAHGVGRRAIDVSETPVAGNIDPVLLLGSADVIRQRTRTLLETMKKGARVCAAASSISVTESCQARRRRTVAALVETAAEFS
jgi:hypothetical protein